MHIAAPYIDREGTQQKTFSPDMLRQVADAVYAASKDSPIRDQRIRLEQLSQQLHWEARTLERDSFEDPRSVHGMAA